MAAPAVLSVTQTTWTTAVTTHNANLPATISAGDGLIIIFGTESDGGEDTAGSITPPAGFTELADVQYSVSGDVRNLLGVFAKVAAGSEAGGTANCATSFACGGAAHVYRIDADTWAQDVTKIHVSVKANAETSNANPPNLAPGVGSKEFLWLVATVWDDNISAPTLPSNFTDRVYNAVNGSEDCGVGSARRALEAESLDPGTWTSAAEKWTALTIGLEPASAGTTHEATASSSISVTGAASGKRVAKATASTSVAVTGAATAHAVRKATGEASITVTGSATGKSQPQRATATSSITVTAAATGKKKAKATATASITVTGAAIGSSPQPAHTATGAADITVTAAATGHKRKHRTATSALTVTCAATGKKTAKATASAQITVTTTARGWVPREHITGPTRLTVTSTPFGRLEVD